MIDYNQVIARTDALVRAENSHRAFHELRSTQVIALAKAMTEAVNKELQKLSDEQKTKV